MSKKKLVYFFGDGKADGASEMKNELGGKGANLAEMTSLGVPVPAGFTIPTDICNYYYEHGKNYPEDLEKQVNKAMSKVEKVMGMKFGDEENPLLVSVRSGARQSMPGMMDTVLNVGLCSKTIPGLIKKTDNPRFVWDAYRRLIMMYSDVVMEKAMGIEPEEEEGGIRVKLEQEMEKVKKAKGYKNDTELTVEELQKLAEAFKVKVKKILGKPFPDDAAKQLWGAIGAVFMSWNGKRAVSYRNIENIPHHWGTAVNVQAMVFGNMGDNSATGVAFTRNPATGENKFYGEWLVNAQGEDVVAGTRTPNALNEDSKTAQNKKLPTLEEKMPKLYKQLAKIRKKLEKHYRDMQDVEFTIQEGRLWMLQTRTGKRNGPAAVKMAVDMFKEKMISKKEAVMRVRPDQLDELLHPMVDPEEEKDTKPIAEGLPAGPGGAYGEIVFNSDRAKELGKVKKVILVRNETSPEDVDGMHAAAGILTAKGGMTSHAALVARGWGKCCIVGCGALDIDYSKRKMSVGDVTLKEGDIITLNGSKGNVYKGELNLIEMDPSKNKELKSILNWSDEFRTLQVWANTDEPEDAKKARGYGAQGIGLTRTEHMFFAEERIKAMREMILSEDVEARRAAVMKLLPYQKKDFMGLLSAMEGLPVTIRLLDPPLHEFLPQETKQIKELADIMKVPVKKIKARIGQLHELNPMLGHRGCRLGIVYPEITEMQARAILEAAAELTKKKKKVFPEIMVPLAGNVKEVTNQKELILSVADEVKKKYKLKKLNFRVGTMIEVPRAALTADEIAMEAEFFSFGTNDLTQMGCGFSRDDAGSFLPYYVENGIYEKDPFQSLDQAGVGKLVSIAVELGRKSRPDLKIGICGEHGGDPDSIDFCHRVGLNYVSCSTARVPVARHAAAQAALRNDKPKKKKSGKKSKKK